VPARIDHRRALAVAAAGVLVALAAVAGALALRDPAPASAPRASAPLPGSPPLVLALPAKPTGGLADLAAVASDLRAGRAAQARTALARARSALGAGDLRVQVAGALLHYRQRAETAIGVLQALVATDDRAPVPALHLGLALLWAGRRAEATSQLEEARTIDPDGFYGRTADDVLHPSYRKGYPLWVRSTSVTAPLAELRRRATAQPRSLRAQLDYAYGLQLASRTRARLVAERALALDATDLDAQVAVIVLGFDKDDPAQAVGRLGQLLRARPDAASPRFHFGELLSWIGRDKQALTEYRQAEQLDPDGLIGKLSRQVLDASR
jgi:tetratricopeptide (TPR) repeat protein